MWNEITEKKENPADIEYSLGERPAAIISSR